MNLEPLTKASQTAGLLCADIREAHTAATEPLAEILLLDLVKQTAELHARIKQVLQAAQPKEKKP